jgi:hypothetical protein
MPYYFFYSSHEKWRSFRPPFVLYNSYYLLSYLFVIAIHKFIKTLAAQ